MACQGSTVGRLGPPVARPGFWHTLLQIICTLPVAPMRSAGLRHLAAGLDDMHTHTPCPNHTYIHLHNFSSQVAELLMAVLPLLDAARGQLLASRLLPRLPDPRLLLRRVGSAATAAAASAVTAARLGVGAGSSVEAGNEDGGLRMQPLPTQSSNGEGKCGTGEPGQQQGSMHSPAADFDKGKPARGVTGKGAIGPVAPAGPCPVCGTEDVLQPLVAVPCGHAYCYYCLASRCGADARYCCPVDGVRVAAMQWRRPN